MRVLLEFATLLATATAVASSPLNVGKNGPVVGADVGTANMDQGIFRPLQQRSNAAAADRKRLVTNSKFGAMRRRQEMALNSMDCSGHVVQQDDAIPASLAIDLAGGDEHEEGAVQEERKVEMKRRVKRYEHNAINLVPRQPVEVTVTTTRTTSVTEAENDITTVTATAVATETIRAGAQGGNSNGTEARESPANEQATTTNAGEASTSAAERESTSNGARPGAEPTSGNEASATNTAESSASPTQAENSAPAESNGAGETSSRTEPTRTQAGEGVASTGENTQTSATGRAQEGGTAGTMEFNNAEGVSIPLEAIGNNLPKPDINSQQSGLPLSAEPGGPSAGTGADLLVPTLSPEPPSGGTLLTPEGGNTPTDNQTPSNGGNTPTDNQTPSNGENTPTDNQSPIENGVNTGSGTPTNTGGTADSGVASENQGISENQGQSGAGEGRQTSVSSQSNDLPVAASGADTFSLGGNSENIKRRALLREFIVARNGGEKHGSTNVQRRTLRRRLAK